MAPQRGSRWFAKERAGTAAAGIVPSRDEIAWAAGFLEGEGCFATNGAVPKGHLRVRATQKNREPLDRLWEMFGGRLNYKKNGHKKDGTKTWLWDWQVNGKRALDVMNHIYPWMSERRKGQIDAAILAAPVEGSEGI